MRGEVLAHFGQNAVIADVQNHAVVQLRHDDLVFHHLVGERDCHFDPGALANFLARNFLSQRRNGQHLAQADRVGFPLDIDVHRLIRLHEIPAAIKSAFADQHLPPQAESLDAGSQVDFIPDDRVFGIKVRTERSGHDRAGVDADAHEQFRRPDLPVVLVYVFHGELHVHGAGQGALHVIRVRIGGAKQHHDRIAHEFVDGAPVTADDVAHFDQISVQEAEHHTNRVVFRNGRESAQVGQQYGDFAAREFLAGRRCRR